jgi:hypothetical protein
MCYSVLGFLSPLSMMVSRSWHPNGAHEALGWRGCNKPIGSAYRVVHSKIIPCLNKNR